MKEMQRQLNRMFGRARPKRKAASVVPTKLKAEARAIGCEVQAHPDGGFLVWPPVGISSDPFKGDHYANDTHEARDILRIYKAALPAHDTDARIYPCKDCGKMRSKNEGGTVFTTCDECWDKHNNKLRESREPLNERRR